MCHSHGDRDYRAHPNKVRRSGHLFCAQSRNLAHTTALAVAAIKVNMSPQDLLQGYKFSRLAVHVFYYLFIYLWAGSFGCIYTSSSPCTVHYVPLSAHAHVCITFTTRHGMCMCTCTCSGMHNSKRCSVQVRLEGLHGKVEGFFGAGAFTCKVTRGL